MFSIGLFSFLLYSNNIQCSRFTFETMLLLLFASCLLFQGASALSFDTQEGVDIKINMDTHVYLENNTDQFVFDLFSCGTANVTIDDGNFKVTLVLNPGVNTSILEICYTYPGGGIGNVCPSRAKFTLADFCNPSQSVWVTKNSAGKYTLGPGCSFGVDPVFDFPKPNLLDERKARLVISSKNAAKWRFGTDACLPPTTTLVPTTTATTVTTTTQKVTTRTTERPVTNSNPTPSGSPGPSCPSVETSRNKSASWAFQPFPELVVVLLMLSVMI